MAPLQWSVVRLADVARPTRPKVSPAAVPHLPFIGMEHVEAHSTKILGAGDSASMRSAGVHFQVGDVLYGRLRPYLNKVALPQFEGLCSAEFIVLSAFRGVDPSFLKHRLNATDFVSFASHLNEGDRPRVDFRQIGAFEFHLPPLEEQQRIATTIDERLSSLAAANAGLARARRNAERYLRAALDSLHDAAAAGSRGTATIRSCVDSLDQGWSPKCDTGPAAAGAWGVIKTTAVQPMQFQAEANKALPPSLLPRQGLTLASGDVLLTRAGPRSRVGVSCVVPREYPRLMNCDKVYRVRVVPGMMLPSFLVAILNSAGYLQRLDDLKTGISDSGVNLTQDRFLDLQIPVPSLEMQRTLVESFENELTNASRLRASLELQIARAARLRDALIMDAVTTASTGASMAAMLNLQGDVPSAYSVHPGPLEEAQPIPASATLA